MLSSTALTRILQLFLQKGEVWWLEDFLLQATSSALSEGFISQTSLRERLKAKEPLALLFICLFFVLRYCIFWSIQITISLVLRLETKSVNLFSMQTIPLSSFNLTKGPFVISFTKLIILDHFHVWSWTWVNCIWLD